MNFSTDLPKSNPLVSYIVASAMKCSRSTSNKIKAIDGSKFKEIPCFRMHAVILKHKRIFCLLTLGNQLQLNNGKGLILCHIRKVASDEGDTMNSKRGVSELNNLHATPKKFKCDTVVEDNIKLPTTANMKIELQALKETETNLKRRGIPLGSIQLDKTWNGYLHKSRKLMEIINSNKEKNYQELYRRIMKDV